MASYNENNYYPFSAVPLGFPNNSLSPDISEYTMYFHHDKHYQGYVDKLNGLLKEYQIMQHITLSELTQIEDTDIRNNAGGVYNHELYFGSLSPDKKTMPDFVTERLDKNFGSADNFFKELKEAALSQFGSGYAWLVQSVVKENESDNSSSSKKLSIIKTDNQNTPDLLKYKIILPVDVWEHAYYLDRQNRRNEYIDAFFNVIDWDTAEARMKSTG